MLSTLLNTPIDVSASTLAHEMDRLFDRQSPSVRASGRWPGLNVWRDGDDIVVEAEVPGCRMDELHVFAQHDTLTIRGERTSALVEGARVLRAERTGRKFSRELTLPVEIDEERVSATLVDGVLRVTLPVAESAKPKRIAITGAVTTPDAVVEIN